jgi:hypothetical protein
LPSHTRVVSHLDLSTLLNQVDKPVVTQIRRCRSHRASRTRFHVRPTGIRPSGLGWHLSQACFAQPTSALRRESARKCSCCRPDAQIEEH